MSKVKIERSMRLFNKAMNVLPAGVSSNARLWQRVCPTNMPCSIFVEKARGSHIWDVDGNEYIDYRLGYGPVILGHSYESVSNQVHRAEENGLVYALSHELEAVVANKIRDMVPCAEMIRFSNSGTEATMHSLRIARAYNGKEKVVKFEGQYHGAHDYVLFSVEPPFNSIKKTRDPPSLPSSLGIPKPIADLIIIQRWNDFEGLENKVRKYRDEIAAIITEPVMGNCAAISPKKGYLEFLRKICDEYNIVLIFDEVKTGFRLARGGAQEIFGVVPDIATFAKSLGNGYPVAAIAGKRKLMENIGPRKVTHGGTYSSNPVSLTAANATLDEMKNGKVHTRLEKYGKTLITSLKDVLADRNIPGRMLGFPSFFQIVFTEDEVWEYRDIEKCDVELYASLQVEMLSRGVMIDEDNMEVCFTSYSHSDEDCLKTVSAMDESLKTLKKQVKRIRNS